LISEEWKPEWGQVLLRHKVTAGVTKEGSVVLVEMEKPENSKLGTPIDEWWDGRYLTDNGFKKMDLPKEPGVYQIDATFWTTGGEEADFNYHVHSWVRIDLLPDLVEETKAVLGGLLEAEECETCVEEDSDGHCENDDDDGQECPCHGRVRKAKEEASRLLSELIPGGKYGGA